MGFRLPWQKGVRSLGGSLAEFVKRDLRVSGVKGWTYEKIPTDFSGASEDYRVLDPDGREYTYRKFKNGGYANVTRTR